MPMSVGSAGMALMHRQIAGKLTGPATKWIVAVFWVLASIGLAGLAAQLSDVQNNEASSWLPQSAESTQALNRLTSFQDPNDLPTVVVYEKAQGALTDADRAAIKADLAAFGKLPGALDPSGYGQPSYTEAPDHQAAQVTLTFNFGANGWNEMPKTADSIRAIADHPGLNVHVTGAGGGAADSAAAFEGLDTNLLLITVSVVILILLITYRSPVLWILPVFSAGVALMCAQGVIYLLAKYADLTVNGQSQGILTVLVFGAGTDYALLLVARYREELRRHEDRHEAMAFALHRATPAILASAMTVILAMMVLLLAEMNSTAGLGPVCAVGIAIGLAVMTTLLPALLVIFGRWFFWPVRPTFGSHEPTTSGRWAQLGNAIARRPRTVWVGTSIALAIACLGILGLNTNGLTQAEQYTTTVDSVVGQEVQVRHGLVDEGSPVMIAVDAAHADAVAAAVTGVRGISAPTATPPINGTVLVSATLTADTASSDAFATVERVRTAAHSVAGADVAVGGTSALLLDMQHAAHRDNAVIMPLVLVVVLLVLMVLLRTVLAPVLLVATVVLSFGAALGISTLVFGQVLGYQDTDAGMPLFAFVFLVALGIDYNIFLMTRVREETQTRGTREGSLIALAATGGVITSAGVVLAATFAALTSMPLVPFVQIGITVAIGVLLDTLIVRSVLVTALNLDLGARIWWPSRLDRGTEAVQVTP